MMYVSEYERRKEEARQEWAERQSVAWQERIQRRREELHLEVQTLINEADCTRLRLAPLYRLSEHGNLVLASFRALIDAPYISDISRRDMLLGALRSVLLDPAIDVISERFREGFGTGSRRILLESEGCIADVIEPPSWPPISPNHPFIPFLYGSTHPPHKQALFELTQAVREEKMQIVAGSVADYGTSLSDTMTFSTVEALALFTFVYDLITYGLVLVENDFIRKSRKPQEHNDSVMEQLKQPSAGLSSYRFDPT